MPKVDLSKAKPLTEDQRQRLELTEEIRAQEHRLLEGNRMTKHWMDEARRRQEELDVALSIRKHQAPVHIVARQGGDTSESTGVLILSDWHVEETVDASTVNGLNEYNLDEADRRIRTLFQKALLLTNIWRKDTRVDTMVVAILGDLISGYIHEELQENNSLSPTQAILWVQRRLVGGLQMLLKEGSFKEIVVPCCIGNHGRCHDEQTELLTREGWKTYDQLRVGELVATYRMDGTGLNDWQPLQDVYVTDYAGEMVYGKTASLDFAVTPKHRMVLVNYHSNTAKFAEMDTVNANTIGANWLPRCAIGHDNDLSDVTDDELRLLGWLHTDGCISGALGKPQTVVSLYQSKEPNIAIIRDLLARLDFEYTEHVRQRDPPIIKGVQCKSAKAEHQFIIKISAHKRIAELVATREVLPDWMFNLSQRQVGIWLESAALGDGNGPSDGYFELYGDPVWLSQVQALLLTNGRAARLRQSNRGDWSLSVRSTYRTFLQNWDTTIVRKPYIGKIWCGTVANGSLITRRNGIPLVSGNTTHKPRVSTAYRNSYEWLMYHNIALMFESMGEKRIKFKIENGYLNYVNVYGRTIRMHHGDAFRYQEGVGGISIPVNKGILRWNKSCNAWLDIFGHWHQFKDDGAWVANSSLIGYNPYAIKIKAPYEPPSQTLLFVERDHGKTATMQIWLGENKAV